MDISDILKHINILLVDDDTWIKDSLTMFFEREGGTLAVCETAEEGMEALKDGDYRMVIAENLLPGMSGLEFLRRVRDSYPHILTMLITAYEVQPVLSGEIGSSVDAVIAKPFHAGTLRLSLTRLLTRGSGGAEDEE